MENSVENPPQMMTKDKITTWLNEPLADWLPVSREQAIFFLILLLAVLTRFYDLGARVMSHDESLHTYYSWSLSRGLGYQHTPMMHGPFQFHVIALTYFLFGASDFTARIPAALMSIMTIALLWHWRRYLGHLGALLAAFFFVISPYMLYYGRYVRNEAYVGLFGLVMLYSMLRYMDTRKPRYLYWLALAATLHFASKETSFIYVAQALLFLGVYLLLQVLDRAQDWQNQNGYTWMIYALITALLFGAIGVLLIGQSGFYDTLSKILLLVTGLALLAAVGFLIWGYGWRRLKNLPAFNLLIVLGTLVLPQLAPLPLHMLDWTVPTDAAGLQALTLTEVWHFGSVLLIFIGLSIALGLAWDKKIWPGIAAIFYGIFLLLYTTLLTNGGGFFSGLVGSLGYWLAQQSVQRGSQPWYYYILIQVPMYEYLPALGIWLAAWLGWRLHREEAVRLPAAAGTETETASQTETRPEGERIVLGLLGWWTLSSLLAYTLAGERMPWLTYHITLPMLLLTGWALGVLIQRIDWHALKRRENWLTLLLSLLFVLGFFNMMRAFNAPIKPFSGKDLLALEATANFSLSALTALFSLGGLLKTLLKADVVQLGRLLTLTFFALLTVLTVRTSFRAAYINYDNATEYLVYAHGARGIKDVMNQIAEVSFRIYGDKSIPVAYDASPPDTGVSWPFTWYFREYTNVLPFSTPDGTLRERDMIIVDAKNFGKIEPVLRNNYYRFDYIRMWWPNQDYFALTHSRNPDAPFPPDYACHGALSFFKLFRKTDFNRLCNAVTDPDIRAGIFDIWFNRDYTRYAAATGSQTLTLSTWQPSDPMRLYIRKDLVAKLWPYGVPAAQLQGDPYADGMVMLAAQRVIGAGGAENSQFNAPRGLTFAPDGSFYVADSLNNRIQHFDANGNFLGAFGVYGSITQGEAPLGMFSEPWDVALGPDGSLYVADTWNHRIQKFSPGGQPLAAWGYWGQDGAPTAFYGPRSIAVGPDGRVFVCDTGNKRIVVFDADGNFITQIGTGGAQPGQLDEPVGIAVDSQGRVYVADTWNQRVQVFAPLDASGQAYALDTSWDVAAWYGQSGENKPFIAVAPNGHVFVTDPEGYRVLEFDSEGAFIRGWGDYGISAENFGQPSGIAVAPDGSVWVGDAGNNRIMMFVPDAAEENVQP